MSGVPICRSGKLGNQNPTGSNMEPAVSKPGRVKPMTYVLFPSLTLGIIGIGQVLVSSVSG